MRMNTTRHECTSHNKETNTCWKKEGNEDKLEEGTQ